MVDGDDRGNDEYEDHSDDQCHGEDLIWC
jgi:hypothetical protein